MTEYKERLLCKFCQTKIGEVWIDGEQRKEIAFTNHTEYYGESCCKICKQDQERKEKTRKMKWERDYQL